MAKEKWMQKAVKHPGALHKALGIAPDKKIPMSTLMDAAHSKNKHMKQMANYALRARGK